MPTFTPNYHIAKPLVNDPSDQDLWGDYWNTNADTIDTTLKTNADAIAAITTVPLGAILPFAGDTAPTNYLLCFGQAVSRTVTYAALFALIGTTYGTGDGSTTFNLPDLRGRAIAGQDDMGGTSANRLTGLSGGVDGDVLGGTGGEESHTLSTAEIPSHTHGLNYKSGVSGALGDGPLASYSTPSESTTFAGSSPDGTYNTMIANAGGGGVHNNVQPTIILNYIIRVT